MRRPGIDQIERPQSLSELAAERIRDAIVSGHYELGAALSENSLTESLGTSKTPIREALALLKHEGLVTVVPQKGTFVFTMSVSDVGQLGAYRFTLESAALDRAMKFNRDALLTSLSECCDAMSAARAKGDMERYLRLDGEFHATILRYCDNRYLQDGYHTIASRVAALRTHLSRHPTHTDKSMGEHVDMVRLLQAGKLKQAKAVLERHLTRGERTYADGIEDIAAASPELRRIARRKR